MEVQYREAFLKDLKQLKSSTSYERIYELAFTTLEAINTLEEISNIKAMRGFAGRRSYPHRGLPYWNRD